MSQRQMETYPACPGLSCQQAEPGLAESWPQEVLSPTHPSPHTLFPHSSCPRESGLRNLSPKNISGDTLAVLHCGFCLGWMYLVLTYKGTVELERLGTTIGANQKDYRMDLIFFPTFYLAQTLILVLVWFVCPPALHCSFLKLLYTYIHMSLGVSALHWLWQLSEEATDSLRMYR